MNKDEILRSALTRLLRIACGCYVGQTILVHKTLFVALNEVKSVKMN